MVPSAVVSDDPYFRIFLFCRCYSHFHGYRLRVEFSEVGTDGCTDIIFYVHRCVHRSTESEYKPAVEVFVADFCRCPCKSREQFYRGILCIGRFKCIADLGACTEIGCIPCKGQLFSHIERSDDYFSLLQRVEHRRDDIGWSKGHHLVQVLAAGRYGCYGR